MALFAEGKRKEEGGRRTIAPSNRFLLRGSWYYASAAATAAAAAAAAVALAAVELAAVSGQAQN